MKLVFPPVAGGGTRHKPFLLWQVRLEQDEAGSSADIRSPANVRAQLRQWLPEV